MKHLTLILLLTAFSAQAVIELTKSNYNNTILNNQHTLVFYYKRYSKASRKLLPKFTHMEEQFPSIKFAKIDAEKYEGLISSLGIHFLPAFELFTWGVPIQFKKTKSITKLRNWVLNATIQEPKPASVFDDIGENDYEIYYQAEDDSKLDRIMNGIAKKFNHLKIYKTEGRFMQVLSEKFEADVNQRDDILMARRAHDDSTYVFNKEIEPLSVELFVSNSEFPDWTEFTGKTEEWLENEDMPHLIFFQDSQTVDKKWIDAAQEAGKQIKPEALVVIADVNDGAVKSFADKHGFREFPLLVMMDHKDGVTEKFLCRKKQLKKVTKKTFYRCLERFNEGRLQVFYRSELAIKWEKEDKVRYVVGKNFLDIYNDYKSNNLVYFYGDNQADLKNLEIFKNYAESLPKIKKLNFNVFNLDKNDMKELHDIEKGMVVMVLPLSEKIPRLKLSGSLNETALTEFIEDNVPVKVYQQIYEAKNQEMIEDL